MQRRERTRHLIELGGLVQKAGLVELTDDDRATLYGAMLDLAEAAGEIIPVVAAEQQAVMALGDEVRNAAQVGAEDGEPAGLKFEDGLGRVVPPDAGDEAEVFAAEHPWNVVVAVAMVHGEAAEARLEPAEAPLDVLAGLRIEVDVKASQLVRGHELEGVGEHRQALVPVVVPHEDGADGARIVLVKGRRIEEAVLVARGDAVDASADVKRGELGAINSKGGEFFGDEARDRQHAIA